MPKPKAPAPSLREVVKGCCFSGFAVGEKAPEKTAAGATAPEWVISLLGSVKSRTGRSFTVRMESFRGRIRFWFRTNFILGPGRAQDKGGGHIWL